MHVHVHVCMFAMHGSTRDTICALLLLTVANHGHDNRCGGCTGGRRGGHWILHVFVFIILEFLPLSLELHSFCGQSRSSEDPSVQIFFKKESPKTT